MTEASPKKRERRARMERARCLLHREVDGSRSIHKYLQRPGKRRGPKCELSESKRRGRQTTAKQSKTRLGRRASSLLYTTRRTTITCEYIKSSERGSPYEGEEKLERVLGLSSCFRKGFLSWGVPQTPQSRFSRAFV